MPLFLNTIKWNYWLQRLFRESKDELIIIVPYIKISETVFQALMNADRKGVDITIIYRENKLDDKEKEKLSWISNLNLLHHPNIHCKCIFNGTLAIIGSMNLYEYSEKNNREMGVLMYADRTDLNEDGWYASADNSELFEDIVVEIREIVNGSQIEQINKNKHSSYLDIAIIRDEEERNRRFAKKLSEYSVNKRFRIKETFENDWVIVCDHYFDRVHILESDRRIEVTFDLPNPELLSLFETWKKTYEKFEFDGFKYFWNKPEEGLLVYKDGKFWNGKDLAEKEYFMKYIHLYDKIVKRYRKITGR